MKRPSQKNGPRLRLWQEWTVYALVGGLAVTGFVWLWLHNFGAVEGEFGPQQSPAERPLLVAHGVLGFGFLLLGGMILDRHVPAAWNQRRHLVTGFSLLGGLSVAALTALGLYYLSNETVRGWTSLIHWAVGAAAIVALLAHAVARRQAKPARPRRAGRKPKAPSA
jgi:peptidoglycan/LPS O-acetylase OafA/YrhL